MHYKTAQLKGLIKCKDSDSVMITLNGKSMQSTYTSEIIHV